MKLRRILYSFPLLVFSINTFSSTAIPIFTMNKSSGGETYSASIEILIFMTMLAFIPAIVMTMTSFLRCIIVLGLLRQAIGLSQTPSNQILVGLSIFMTIFIMSPVFHKIGDRSITPYLNNKITLNAALKYGEKPLRSFMLNQTRKDEINFFINLSGIHKINSRDKIPFTVLIPAYMTSELQTAFQIGFILFIPFLLIDLIVSSTLMAMGMMMVSPMVISMPLKIMLFVMINGWHLVLGTLAKSFNY